MNRSPLDHHGPDSFGSLSRLDLGGERYRIHRLDAVPGSDALPFSLKIMLENLLRHEDGVAVTADHIRSLADADRVPGRHAVQFSPSRVFLHDTNGVPVLADLAALRDAVTAAGVEPRLINPRIPAELTVDHSISTDVSARPDAPSINTDREYERNAERYRFLKWGTTLDGFRVIPPNSGIMHQINLEYLARVVERRDGWAYPDTCAGTDSHTTMVNGLGVLAWGVGGIEAGAALLGQPVTMLVPPVVGVNVTGELPPGTTATDLVLTITERLRRHGVVGKFVEFHGSGLATIPIVNRATIANMSPEYGSTSAIFPIDELTLEYLRFTGRAPEHVAAVERYSKEQGLWHEPARRPRFDEHFELDLGTIESSLAGPRRPQDRIPLRIARQSFRDYLRASPEQPAAGAERGSDDGAAGPISDGAVAIAAITSCTNTSNPQVMIGAGLFARNARRRGLTAKPWVKTSLAPGSKTVTDYLTRAGLTPYLDELGFQLVGYGCMTCIGNSGPLLPDMSSAVAERGVRAAAVLSGNRNFDRRINNEVSLNYLASPPLVVAYAIAGTMDHDMLREPLGTDGRGEPVYFSELWPDDAEIEAVIREHLTPDMFTSSYARIFDGEDRWAALATPSSGLFDWDEDSTYLRRPPYFEGLAGEPAPPADILGARVFQLLGDSVTTDHISPAGRIPGTSASGLYLRGLGVPLRELNTYASRRGNHEVMIRGGFTNPGLRNALSGDRVGGWTLDVRGDVVPASAAAESFREAGVPLVVIAGREYGTGSSRDWAAKVTALLGVRAVIAESFERIHRSNLVQLGVLPLQFLPGQGAAALGLDGTEVLEITGLDAALDRPDPAVTVRASRPADGARLSFEAVVRIDTRQEAEYYRHGGILPYVYRDFLRRGRPAGAREPAEGIPGIR